MASKQTSKVAFLKMTTTKPQGYLVVGEAEVTDRNQAQGASRLRGAQEGTKAGTGHSQKRLSNCSERYRYNNRVRIMKFSLGADVISAHFGVQHQ